MNSYEKNIGLRTMWLTFIRRFKIILLFFIPILLVSFLGTKKVFKTSYQSNMTVTTGGVINLENHTNLVNFVTKTETKEKVSSALSKKATPIIIEPSAIAFSITSWKNNLTSMSISFKSNNNTIATEVMNELKTYISDPENFQYATRYQFNEPTSSTINKQKKYFLILAFLGAMISVGLAFYDEVSSDEVYDVKDVKLMGLDGFELDTNLQ